MYTADHGFEKSYSITVKKFSPTVSLDGTASKTQVGIGVSKELGSGWKAGIGCATEFTEWDPDLFGYISKHITF